MSDPTNNTTPTASTTPRTQKLQLGTRVWLKEELQRISPESSQSTGSGTGTELKTYVILQNNGAPGQEYRLGREDDVEGPDWWYGRKELERVPGVSSKGSPSVQMSHGQAVGKGVGVGSKGQDSAATEAPRASTQFSTQQATGESASASQALAKLNTILDSDKPEKS